MALQEEEGAAVEAVSTTTYSRSGQRRWLIRGLSGLSLLGVGVFIIGCYALLRPAEGSSVPPSTASYPMRWESDPGDPGPVYDRIPVTPSPVPSPTPAPTPAPMYIPPPTPVPPPVDSIPYQMVIERIGVNAPVVAKGMDKNFVPVVPLNSYQVAWYTFSAQPGTGGNAVFAGHVTWDGRAVFYSLSKLVPGDTVQLLKPDGQTYVYTVSESYLVSEHDTGAPARVMGPTTTDTITIITCDGDFYYTGDPVYRGSYTNRRVIRATLVSQSGFINSAW